MTKKTAIIVISCIIAACIAACAATGLIVKTICAPKDEIECIDGCDIPRYDENGNEVFAIVSPMGYNAVDTITQAPRLDTLDGKKIALIGGSFMASTTHFELKRCIEEKYPTAQLYMFNQIGTNGPFSIYKATDRTNPNRFQKKLIDEGIDAVICGNCGCGLCTTKESGSAIAAEYVGIPAVTVGAPTFISQIHSIGVNRGVPVLRAAEYPGAFAAHTTEQLKENARHVVFPQIEEALTKPITEAEIKLYRNQGERPYDEIVFYGNNDEIQDWLQTNQFGDGLPVTPPTDAKIKEYLRFTPYAADKLLGRDAEKGFPQAFRKCYTYTVAANAVMAGVPKEFTPLCIAFVECMDGPDWMQTLLSTHGWSPFAWVNGPIARQLGIDCGQGMISEEANKAFGRFIDLALLNIGGYYVKENRMGTFGYLSPWTFSEDEESCLQAGWEPYHVTQGYDLDANTVTAGSALAWGNNITPSTTDPEEIKNVIAFDITEKQQNGLGNTNPQVYRTVFITKAVADLLSRQYESKDALENALIDAARRPLWLRAYALYYANTGSRQDDIPFDEYYEKLKNEATQKYTEQAEITDPPDWYKGLLPEETLIWTIPTMNKGETKIIVTGDDVRNKVQVMPGGGYATAEIRLPDNWDELVAPMGYEPLASFRLSDKYDNAEATDIAAPDGLSDGTYMLVTDKASVADGKINFSFDTVSFFQNDGIVSLTLDSDDADKAFAKLLAALKAPCSVTVTNGVVTDIVIRPASAARANAVTDISTLKTADFGTANITFSINITQSRPAGGVTRNGTTVIISSTVEQMKLELGGAAEIIADENNSAEFITCENGILNINTRAAGGSVATFKAQNADGTFRTVTFTMKINKTITIEYGNGEAQ